MKRLFALLLALIMCSGLMGCGDDSGARASETSSSTSALEEATPLFDDIYLHFAVRSRGQALDYSSAAAFVKNSGYPYEIKEPTDETVATMHVYADKNSPCDYVFLSFGLYEGFDEELVMTVSYHQDVTNREVSRGNYSSNNSYKYDNFYAQTIGESPTKVSDVTKQAAFLFGD